jgi:hypothetical protein
MDIVLLVITVVSVGVALVMSAIAARLSREERTRATARVAALRVAAEAEPVPTVEAIAEPIAVGESRGPAPWPPARVHSFATPARPAATAVAARVVADEGPTPALGDAFLGSTAAPSVSAGRQRSLAVAAVVLFLAAIGGGSWLVFAGRTTAASSAGAATTTGAALELVSLRHERRGPTLDVTGLVRNPVGGSTLDKLTAVVFLFDRQGGFLTSARAHVDYLSLVPGDESPFVISMSAPSSVARYRVSFRNDGGVVPHVDRRGQEPLAAHAITPSPAATR